MQSAEKFLKIAQSRLTDKDWKQRSEMALTCLDTNRQQGIINYANLDLARQRAAYAKWKVTENLDKYLVDFEGSVIRRGGKVVWAYDSANALHEIDTIIKRTQARKILTSKSSVMQEINLTEHLKRQGKTVVQTDIGEYILDQTKGSSFHPVVPALPMKPEELSRALNQKIKSSLEADNPELASDIRAEIRPEFLQADLGITGANFLIADTGSVAITENEGNVRLSFAFAKTHVVVASIDKIIPSLNDLDLFFSLLSTHATGQAWATYNTITGPSYREDTEGPSEFIVILLDNGRSNILATQDQRQSLHCIQCGACNNVCPVFRLVGGQSAYQQGKGGPIGMVATPLQYGLNEFQYLSQASTLCGKCTQVCPVRIDIHNHLLRNRHDAIQQGFEKTGEKFSWYTWKKFMLSRKNLNRPASLKNFTFKQFYKSDWGEKREFPRIADKSFNQLWREKFGSD